MRSSDNRKKAVLAELAACIIFGTSFMATSIALGGTSPEILLSVRFTVSVITMLIMLAAGAGKLDLRNKPMGKFLLLGLCEPVIYFYAETYGLKYTTSSFAGVMIALIPVLAAVMSAWLLREKLPAAKVLWIICSLSGVVIISAKQSSEGVIRIKGILFLLVAMIAASFFSILSRSLAGIFTPFERTFVMMLMGSVAFSGAACVKYRGEFVQAVTDAVREPAVLLPILFLAVFSSVVAYSLANYSLTYLDVSTATIFGNIIPVVSLAAGVLLLGEPFSVSYIPAIVLILLGVYKVTMYK